MRCGLAPAQGHNAGFYQSFATVTTYADSTAPAMLNERDIARLLGVIINKFLCCARRGFPCPLSLCLCTQLYPNGEKDCQRRSIGKTQRTTLQKAAGLIFFYREALQVCFTSCTFGVFALMLKPFCTLDSSRSSPVQWATTTSIRTLVHIFTNSLKPSIQINMQLGLSQEMTPRKRGRGCLLFRTTRTFHMKLFPWNPKSHFLHAYVPLCTGRREGEGHESTSQSKGTFSRTECK